MRSHWICLVALLACATTTPEAAANGGRLFWDGARWVGSAIAGGVLYDSVKPDAAEAAPPERDDWRPPAYGPAPGPQPMTDVCVVPGLGGCRLPYPIPEGAPCSCY